LPLGSRPTDREIAPDSAAKMLLALQNMGNFALPVSVEVSLKMMNVCNMPLLSSGDDNIVKKTAFGFRVHGPRPREIATPPDLLLNSPSPANIGDLRLPVSVEVSVSKIEGLLSRPI